MKKESQFNFSLILKKAPYGHHVHELGSRLPTEVVAFKQETGLWCLHGSFGDYQKKCFCNGGGGMTVTVQPWFILNLAKQFRGSPWLGWIGEQYG